MHDFVDEIRGRDNMDGKLRNMSSVYLTKGDKILLLFRQGGQGCQ